MMQAFDVSQPTTSLSPIRADKGTLDLSSGFQRTVSLSGGGGRITDSRSSFERIRTMTRTVRGAPELAIKTIDGRITAEIRAGQAMHALGGASPVQVDERPLTPDTLRAWIATKLDDLRRAASRDDEVEAHAIGVSVRHDLKDLRRAWQANQPRRFGLGYVYDALAFTPPGAMSRDAADVLKNAFAAASTETLTREALLQIRDALDAAGLELQPRPSA